MRAYLPLALMFCASCAQGADGRTNVDAGPTPRDLGADGFVPGADQGARPDAGSADAGPGADLGPPLSCSSAADCDNGLACDGVEICNAGTCQAGTPVPCDDGVACTVDQCVEPAGTCGFAPDNGRCAAGETCDPIGGCRTDGPTCSETPCKLVGPQCGCGVGQGCYMDPDGDRSCAAAGFVATGGACTSIVDCQPGDTCISLSASVAGCQHFCATDADCGGRPGALCILGLQDTMMVEIPGVRVCTLGCEPATQTGCPSGSWCFLGQESAGAMRDLSHCSADPPGPGTQGAGCASQDDCAPGYICLDPGTGTSQCLHLCRDPSTLGPISSPDCTSVLQDCYSLDPGIALGSTEYGVCF